ncbi:hypothetical protein C8R45DRAFT_1002776 [Mycena sanguinolenta]|nr:hypothetical protein C8R45DRAFT_1002776 [Mycena sanguinolenta]
MTTNVHDEINLKRLIRRLEKSASDSQWTVSSDDTWIKVQGTLQKVKYARKLLGNVELEDMEPTPKSVQRYEDWRTKLNRIDTFMQELEERTAPKQTRPQPILPQIPAPRQEPQPTPRQSEAVIVPGEDPTPAILPAGDLLLSVTDVERATLPPSSARDALIPSMGLATKSTTTAVESRLMQHSNARQRDMSDQLALMATQLKRNAIHFGELLAKDQAVLEDTDKKLEGNFGYMQQTQTRMKSLNTKTSGSTCTRLLIIFVVVFVFMFMVFFMRFSGR